MKIAMLGGSFNPIHIGHLALADAALCSGYDKIIFIPAAKPPHKFLAKGASDEDRLSMLYLATKENNRFCVDDCELRRTGISYTIDTIYYLEEKYKESIDGKIGLLLGNDLLDGFSLWKNVEILINEVDLVVGKRNSFLNSKANFFSLCEYKALENSLLPISSSGIRNLIKDKGSWRYLVRSDVYHYIKNRNLYGFNA